MTPKERLDAALEAYGMDYYLRRVDPDAGDHPYHLAGAKAAVLAAHTACLAEGKGLDFKAAREAGEVAVRARIDALDTDTDPDIPNRLEAECADLNAQHRAIVGALKARIAELEAWPLLVRKVRRAEWTEPGNWFEMEMFEGDNGDTRLYSGGDPEEAFALAFAALAQEAT